VFSGVMVVALAGLANFVLSFLDDILLFSSIFYEDLEHAQIDRLRDILFMLCINQSGINPVKYSIKVIRFLNFHLTVKRLID
jgi:predicted MarR family transcription regulator